MSNVPSDLHYAKSHEWVKSAADGTALIGITDYAQNSLGDITFVQLPKVGDVLAIGDTFGVVESVKAASDLYSPVAGTVLELNADLDATPEVLNQDPYGAGWMMKVQVSGSAEDLLDSAAYTAHTA